MSVERSQDKLRPRTPRPGTGSAVLTAPHRDENTGRFLPENDFSRLRRLRATYEVGFVGLNPDEVVAYLRPFVVLANRDAARLIEETGAETSPSLTGLAEQAANALAFARGLQALAAGGDARAAEQARHWMREFRQFVIALRAEARTPLRETDPGAARDKAAKVAKGDAEDEAAMERQREAERQAQEQRLAEGEAEPEPEPA